MLQPRFSDAPNMIECSSCAAGKSTGIFPKPGYSPKSNCSFATSPCNFDCQYWS